MKTSILGSWHYCHCYFSVSITTGRLKLSLPPGLLSQGVDPIFISQCPPCRDQVGAVRSTTDCRWSSLLSKPIPDSAPSIYIHHYPHWAERKCWPNDHNLRKNRDRGPQGFGCSLLIRPVLLRPLRSSVPTESVVESVPVGTYICVPAITSLGYSNSYNLYNYFSPHYVSCRSK